MSQIIRVLIVDDSAFVRKVVRQILSRSPFIEVVGTAHDGIEALRMTEELNPDVITLDLNMPNSDGIDFLQKQMKVRPLPVIVLSIASQSGELAMQALDAGAVDIVTKPTALANDRVFEVSEDLIAKVKAASVARIRPTAAASPKPPTEVTTPRAERTDIVVIGVSTGGPQALKKIIPALPADFPVPIAMVLHMPIGYTELFARSLDAVSPLSIIEAREGCEVRAGTAILAAAGYHLSFVRTTEGVVAKLGLQPLDLLHRPSVDVMFHSAADLFGKRTLGVVLTGMGSDGTHGAAWIKAQGGRVFSEAEESCVVYGMPRSVSEAGLSDRVVPLDRMAEAIMGAL